MKDCKKLQGENYNNNNTALPGIGMKVRVFANGDLRSTPGPVIPKTFKMVLDVSLLNTQKYKVAIKGKVEQSRERSRALQLSKRGPSGHP